MKQILALHRLLQQGSVLQHQRLDLVDQMAILLLQVALQLTQELNITQTCTLSQKVNTTSAPPAACPYLTLVGELRGGDVQLLILLFELGEVGLQPGVLQLGLVQLALQLLVIHCQRLVVVKELTVSYV